MDIQTVHPYNQGMKLLSRILPLNNILLNLPATSKKRAFEQAGLLFENNNGLERAAVFESLFARERLGSTGLGDGVAVPHGRVKGINHSVAAFLRLDHPIPFDSPDGKPVNQLLCLMAPESAAQEHLDPVLRLGVLLRVRAAGHGGRPAGLARRALGADRDDAVGDVSVAVVRRTGRLAAHGHAAAAPRQRLRGLRRHARTRRPRHRWRLQRRGASLGGARGKDRRHLHAAESRHEQGACVRRLLHQRNVLIRTRRHEPT